MEAKKSVQVFADRSSERKELGIWPTNLKLPDLRGKTWMHFEKFVLCPMLSPQLAGFERNFGILWQWPCSKRGKIQFHMSVRNGRKLAKMWNILSGYQLCGLQLGWAMNWVDQLRTSADECLLSGLHAVLMVSWDAVSCVCSALTCHFSWNNLLEPRKHYHFQRRSAELSWCQVRLLTQSLQRCSSRCACVHAYVHVVCVCIYVYVCVCSNMYICI